MLGKLATDEFHRKLGLSEITSDKHKAKMNIFSQKQVDLRNNSRHYAALVQEESKNSISSLFGVSEEAMAIRQEELNILVKKKQLITHDIKLWSFTNQNRYAEFEDKKDIGLILVNLSRTW